jgi:tetratricopeptide (TPR) repeat protein
MKMTASLARRRLLVVCIALSVAAGLYFYSSADTSVKLYFAEKALHARKAEDAIAWLKSIPQRRAVPQREFLLARAYRRLGQQDLTREHLQFAHDLGFSVERLEREQWLAMAQSGQMREAEPYFRRLLQDPGNDGQEICEAFVKGYFRNRQFHKAIPVLDAWQAEFPDDPQPYAFRGAAFQEIEDWKSAITEYQKVLQWDADQTVVRVQLAVCLKAARKYDEAIEQFRRCLKESPEDPILLAEWGDILLLTGTVKEATVVFEQLLAIDPQNPEARLAMAGIHLSNGDAKKALEIAEPLYSERRFDKSVMYSLASALQAYGRVDEAKAMFERVNVAQEKLLRKNQLMEELQSDPNLVDHRFEIAIITMNYQSPSDGVRWLLSVIDIDPQYTPAYLALADYYKSVGNAELELQFRTLAESHSNARKQP